ncbi:ACT domain-containing protein [Adlercreutzia caecimuris]|jgi:ACT domain-containing protein|uniref:ACT domain-containing protein n=1 Tax=Adlercreutzia caecimuris TaxID=671266 RepID=UPI000EDD60FE|nr:ACT domain-containing protein [Adlercreutzia caecimuris]MCI9207773.1 ACT domain-containing protein [Adlercreutzia caecimuris]MCR2037876.1 ACT domain-containing protein [Adlercreutzia caecimuris]NBJ65749.1 ACT domain-containing protein [Adlercreutzia caecimuris]
MKCVISVLGKDRSGVVAAIAGVLADCGANIDDISQTILGEGRMFSMTMMVSLDVATADFNTVQERLTATGETLGMQVLIQREDVFQAMYQI